MNSHHTEDLSPSRWLEDRARELSEKPNVADADRLRHQAETLHEFGLIGDEQALNTELNCTGIQVSAELDREESAANDPRP